MPPSTVPKDTKYYDLLGVPSDADSGQIKRAYYRLAIKYHPDKNLGNKEEAEQKFKEIGEAYQVLSDETLRKRYDEFGVGANAMPEGGFRDPRTFFRQTFGGEGFVDIIGEISFARLLDTASEEAMRQQANPSATGSEKMFELSPEARAELERAHQERVSNLLTKLNKKLSLYVDGLYAPEEFREYCLREASNLKNESYGVQLLQTVGYVYSNKAKQYLGRDEFLGLPGFYHSVKEKGHIMSGIFSAVSAYADVAREQKRQQQHRLSHEKGTDKSDASNAGKKDGGEASKAQDKDDVLYDEQESLPEIDEAKVFELVWKMSAVEVESVLREVCDQLLARNQDATIGPGAKAILKKRAMALKILGDAYRKVQPDEHVDKSSSIKKAK